ncbi:hypothetical protein JR334_10790 [Clostridia bacterium]|nr:hypothetical protein JR334_10790 [Clostridia bacterium]
MENLNTIQLLPVTKKEQDDYFKKIKKHAKELTAFYEDQQMIQDSHLERLFSVLDYELNYLSKLGQEKVARIYLLSIHHKGDSFDVNRYPLHTILIECCYMARTTGELREEFSGGFIWQIVVDALQSHLLDWIISPVDYNVKDKLINHLRKLLAALA